MFQHSGCVIHQGRHLGKLQSQIIPMIKCIYFWIDLRVLIAACGHLKDPPPISVMATIIGKSERNTQIWGVTKQE